MSSAWLDTGFAPFWGAIAFAFVLAHFYIEPLRWWGAYLRPRVAWTRTRDMFNATALASYLLPFKLGLPLRLMLVSRITMIDRFSIAGLMAVDSAIGIVAWTSAGLLLGGPLMFRHLPSPPAWLWFCIGVAIVGVAAILMLGHLNGLLTKFVVLRTKVRENPGRMLVAVTLVLLDVASYGARHACLGLAVGMDAALVPAWAGWGIVATFAGMASGLPMGLVGYEATILVFTAAHGISPVQAAAVIALNRGMSFAAAAITGLPASRRLGIGNGFRALASTLKELVGGK